eukprot:3405542-Amphidinium_carterae.1
MKLLLHLTCMSAPSSQAAVLAPIRCHLSFGSLLCSFTMAKSVAGASTRAKLPAKAKSKASGASGGDKPKVVKLVAGLCKCSLCGSTSRDL